MFAVSIDGSLMAMITALEDWVTVLTNFDANRMHPRRPIRNVLSPIVFRLMLQKCSVSELS